MKRRTFIQSAGVLTGGLLLKDVSSFAKTTPDFPIVRTPVGSRKFTSKAIEKAITTFKSGVKNKELGWLFENCFPNTLDTTVFHQVKNGVPDTYVITGD
ncbi:MAG TPA: glycoside hydrolase family 125 protein, partial [Hanamia sp.]|nr:glycoside hydrolase family 125 protein [Hanamia sp.]